MRGKPPKIVPMIPFLTAACFFLAAAPTASAAGEFTTSYDVLYTATEGGQTKVIQNITLTNNTSDLYASDYTLVIGSEKVEDIAAADRKGPLSPKVRKTKGQTEIKVVFNDKVVGLGKNLLWSLSYETSDTTNRHGDVWEIIIPRLAKAEQTKIKEYRITVVVPKNFGPELYVSPPPDKFTTLPQKRSYTFKKEQFEETGVMLAFGSSQKFAFKLTYHLKNPNFLTATTKIAFPPDILGVQQIVFKTVSPPPETLELDADGNYLALYRLGGREKKDIVVEGWASVLHPKRELSKSGTLKDIPEKLASLYTRPQKYWETDDPEIKNLLKEITDPKDTVAQTARKIYDFVVSSLSYSPQRIGKELTRFRAKKALKKKDKAVCMEYTDLFITLLRSSGIPARGLEGFAFTENEALRPTIADALHSWVEIYIPKVGWIGTDPTWASTTGGLDYFTKLDTNHLVFAIKGLSSETPYPAGTYKLSPEQKEDIKVAFLKEKVDPEVPPRIEVVFKLPKEIPAGFPVSGEAIVKNSGEVSIFGLETTLVGNLLKKPSPQKTLLGTLPPFGKKEIKVDLYKQGFLRSSKEKVVLAITYQTFGGKVISQKSEEKLNLRPLFLIPKVQTLLLASGLGLFVIVFLLLSLQGAPQRLLARLLDRLQGQDR